MSPLGPFCEYGLVYNKMNYFIQLSFSMESLRNVLSRNSMVHWDCVRATWVTLSQPEGVREGPPEA